MRPEGHLSREEAVRLTGMASDHYFADLASNMGSGPPYVLIGRTAWYPAGEFLKWMDDYEPSPRQATPDGYMRGSEIDDFVGKHRRWWHAQRNKPKPLRQGRHNTFYDTVEVMQYLSRKGILQQMIKEER